MAIAITIVVTLLIVVVISAFFLIRPRKKLNYGRMMNNEYRPEDDDNEPVSRPIDRPRSRRMKNFDENTSLTPLIIGIIRAVIGLIAVGVLAYIYSSTQNALNITTIDAQTTPIYAEGIFKAVITIGVAAGLYIFTKFHR